MHFRPQWRRQDDKPAHHYGPAAASLGTSIALQPRRNQLTSIQNRTLRRGLRAGGARVFAELSVEDNLLVAQRGPPGADWTPERILIAYSRYLGSFVVALPVASAEVSDRCSILLAR